MTATATDEIPWAPEWPGLQRMQVFGKPEHHLERLHRYMRKGCSQQVASLAAWGWPSFVREHNDLAVEAARFWGEVADTVNAALDRELDAEVRRAARASVERWAGLLGRLA